MRPHNKLEPAFIARAKLHPRSVRGERQWKHTARLGQILVQERYRPFQTVGASLRRTLGTTINRDRKDFWGFVDKYIDLRVQESKSPRAHESKSPRVQESKSPKVQESKSPRVQESKSPRVQEFKSPRVQESKSSSPRVKKLY
ncbi:conserved hypothetical protein [Culex quinquefasciatus]|uniref:Uncharacterized protein n=1 Tax=Culex quinquefasciatus TaxID=7176 RepID=B0XA61_CULQU|nr:conserved hypothetical protein [Culex quinquefasciatus]|eukprot:XP_001866533.1 conserved hypothetical protein [Culex quinquefasciatus]